MINGLSLARQASQQQEELLVNTQEAVEGLTLWRQRMEEDLPALEARLQEGTDEKVRYDSRVGNGEDEC